MSVPPMLKVVNTSDKPFVGRYKQQRMTIPPHAEMYVEGGAVVTWFGNPDTRNAGRLRDRETEFKRIRLMWLGARVNEEKNWEMLRPSVEVYTAEGERFWTVADDPAGEQQQPDTGDDSADAQIKSLKAQVSAMQAALTNLMGQDQQDEPQSDMPVRKDSDRQPLVIEGEKDKPQISPEPERGNTPTSSGKVTVRDGEVVPPVDNPRSPKKG